MYAVKDCMSLLASQVEWVHIDLLLLKQDFTNLGERATEKEGRMTTLTQVTHSSKRELSVCKLKLDD